MTKEFTFLKPDSIARGLVGKIISRYEEAGFRIVRLKKGRISRELAELLYPNSQEQLTGMGKKTITATLDKGGTDKDLQKRFGTTDPYKIGETLNEWNRKFATSTEIVAMVLEGEGDAPTKVREIVGATDPAKAAKGTIRGDYAEDSIYAANLEMRACRNLVHASDSERAPVEVELFEKHFF
jgi:nucleoside-diphosphate kinase